jgi:hypothetical protein
MGKTDINDFLKILGHCGSDRLEMNAKIHDLKLKGKFKTCEQCDIIKFRQNNISKDWKVWKLSPWRAIIVV